MSRTTGLLDGMVRAAVATAERKDLELRFHIAPTKPVQPCGKCGETLFDFVALVNDMEPLQSYQTGQVCLGCQTGFVEMNIEGERKRWEIAKGTTE